jgi:hypothetical protein
MRTVNITNPIEREREITPFWEMHFWVPVEIILTTGLLGIHHEIGKLILAITI